MNSRSHLADLDSTDASMTPLHVSLDDLRACDITDIDAFLGILPDELRDDWFEAIGQSSSDPRNGSTEMASTRPFFNFA